MNAKYAKRLVIITVLVAGTSSGVALAETSGSNSPTSGPSSSVFTPNDCIRRNGGDYNACNVGNSGRGDLPYQQVQSSWVNPNLLHSRVR